MISLWKLLSGPFILPASTYINKLLDNIFVFFFYCWFIWFESHRNFTVSRASQYWVCVLSERHDLRLLNELWLHSDRQHFHLIVPKVDRRPIYSNGFFLCFSLDFIYRIFESCGEITTLYVYEVFYLFIFKWLV